MSEKVEYKTSKNDEWKEQHFLSTEELKKLIEEKVSRAKICQKLISRYVVKHYD